MHRKTKPVRTMIHQNQKYSDAFLCLLFTTFCTCAFLLMFSYADKISHPPSGNLREPLGSGIFDDDLEQDEAFFSVKNYTWKCIGKGQCQRFLVRQSEEQTTLETCNMLCGLPPLWPKPKKISLDNKGFSVIPNKGSIYFNNENDNLAGNYLSMIVDLFVANLKYETKSPKARNTTVRIVINVVSEAVSKLELTTDESYTLSVKKPEGDEVIVKIFAQNFFGARHGLETLSQLFWYDSATEQLKIVHGLDVEDYPSFPYRGLMVDTARNYFPLSQLKGVVRGMAMSKLNVLHLHLTDATSFPVVLPRVKILAKYGAYGQDMVYTADDIDDLVGYALIRGIRVVLEVDAPSHVNAGWRFADELNGEKLVICGEDDIFKGQLNPDNPLALDTLERIYSDLLDLSRGSDLFHIGADEVSLECWQRTKAANDYNDMKSFWKDYTNQMLNRLKRANDDQFPRNIIMWSSPLTNSPYIKDLVGNITVQSWLGYPSVALRNGNTVIYSTVGRWYLDCGFGMWKPDMHNGVCDPYTPWQTVYEYRPWVQQGHRDLTLGGEACLWTEQVGSDDLETRLWPRTAAFAERIWSDPVRFDKYDVYTRLAWFSERLKDNDIRVAAVWPKWCLLNPGKCGF